MLEVVKEQIEDSKNGMYEMLLSGQSIGKVDFYIVAQLKGYLLSHHEILNIKTYLVEAIEDEVQSIGTTNSDQG